MNKFIPVIFLGLLTVLFAFRRITVNTIESIKEKNVADVVIELGEEKPKHYLSIANPELVKKGEQLIKKGYVKSKVRRSKIISPYFVCIDCHSLNRESENSQRTSPDDRLKYAIQTNQPFYPGSTFWGIYNRTSWYNDDYDKKYGELISEARNSLKESIQVCAKYCSAGRFLEDWEVEAIMHFYKANELKIADLSVDPVVYQKLESTNLGKEEKKELLSTISSSFKRKEAATFLPTMEREKRKYGEGADPKKGKEIFNRSCMHCHFQGRVSHLKLDNDQLTARWFVKNLKEYTDESLYQIIRYGTYTRAGRNQYMPLYTKEKMSDEQIEDLVAYMKQLANN